MLKYKITPFVMVSCLIVSFNAKSKADVFKEADCTLPGPDLANYSKGFSKFDTHLYIQENIGSIARECVTKDSNNYSNESSISNEVSPWIDELFYKEIIESANVWNETSNSRVIKYSGIVDTGNSFDSSLAWDSVCSQLQKPAIVVVYHQGCKPSATTTYPVSGCQNIYGNGPSGPESGVLEFSGPSGTATDFYIKGITSCDGVAQVIIWGDRNSVDECNPDPPPEACPGSGNSLCINSTSGVADLSYDNLRSIMIHEFGHIVGLGHSHEDNNGDNRSLDPSLGYSVMSYWTDEDEYNHAINPQTYDHHLSSWDLVCSQQVSNVRPNERYGRQVQHKIVSLSNNFSSFNLYNQNTIIINTTTGISSGHPVMNEYNQNFFFVPSSLGGYFEKVDAYEDLFQANAAWVLDEQLGLYNFMPFSYSNLNDVLGFNHDLAIIYNDVPYDLPDVSSLSDPSLSVSYPHLIDGVTNTLDAEDNYFRHVEPFHIHSKSAPGFNDSALVFDKLPFYSYGGDPIRSYVPLHFAYDPNSSGHIFVAVSNSRFNPNFDGNINIGFQPKFILSPLSMTWKYVKIQQSSTDISSLMDYESSNKNYDIKTKLKPSISCGDSYYMGYNCILFWVSSSTPSRHILYMLLRFNGGDVEFLSSNNKSQVFRLDMNESKLPFSPSNISSTFYEDKFWISWYEPFFYEDLTSEFFGRVRVSSIKVSDIGSHSWKLEKDFLTSEFVGNLGWHTSFDTDEVYLSWLEDL